MSTLPVRLIFLLAAAIIFALAAVAPFAGEARGLPARPNLVATGLLCLTVALLAS